MKIKTLLLPIILIVITIFCAAAFFSSHKQEPDIGSLSPEQLDEYYVMIGKCYDEQYKESEQANSLEDLSEKMEALRADIFEQVSKNQGDSTEVSEETELDYEYYHLLGISYESVYSQLKEQDAEEHLADWMDRVIPGIEASVHTQD